MHLGMETERKRNGQSFGKVVRLVIWRKWNWGKEDMRDGGKTDRE